MSGRKWSPTTVMNGKKGLFFFEFLVSLFLLSMSLAIIWSGFLHVLKNYHVCLNTHKQIMLISQILEFGKKDYDSIAGSNCLIVKKSVKKGLLETAELLFEIDEVALVSKGDTLEGVKLWRYCGD